MLPGHGLTALHDCWSFIQHDTAPRIEAFAGIAGAGLLIVWRTDWPPPPPTASAVGPAPAQSISRPCAPRHAGTVRPCGSRTKSRWRSAWRANRVSSSPPRASPNTSAKRRSTRCSPTSALAPAGRTRQLLTCAFAGANRSGTARRRGFGNCTGRTRHRSRFSRRKSVQAQCLAVPGRTLSATSQRIPPTCIDELLAYPYPPWV